MERFYQYIARMNIDALLRARTWLGGLLLVLGNLLQLLVAPPSRLKTCLDYALLGVPVALALLLVIVFDSIKRRPLLLPTAALDLMGNLSQASCAVAAAVCAWAGLWPLACAYVGLVLLTLPARAARYALLVPIFDNGEPGEPNAGSIWAHLVVDGDGVNMLLYKERPDSLDDAPMARVIVECHRNELRLLGWSEGVCIDDDPNSVEVLVADVLTYKQATANEPGEGKDG